MAEMEIINDMATKLSLRNSDARVLEEIRNAVIEPQTGGKHRATGEFVFNAGTNDQWKAYGIDVVFEVVFSFAGRAIGNAGS